jgi:transcriptional regulator with XRE-family HTH domain
MVSMCTASMENTRSPLGALARIFRCMETPDTTRRTLDPRMQQLAGELESLRRRLGMSKRQLAVRSGVHATQLGQFLLGRVGLSYEKACDVSRALGAALVVEVGDDAHPLRIGTVDELGRFMSDTTTLTLPGIIEVQAAFGPFAPGDQIHVRHADSFESGRWVLVERAGGGRSLVRCAEREGARVLIDGTGDAVLYEPARHRIIARVYGRLEAM